jgi:hypothetical protein
MNNITVKNNKNKVLTFKVSHIMKTESAELLSKYGV